MTRRYRLSGSAGLLALFFFCGLAAANTAAPDPRGPPAAPRTQKQAPKVHRGKASIYSRRLAHKPMADGSKLDLNSNAAASKQLPLGSKAVVTNLRNGKSAEVTIQDRGPYVGGRIIDLSPHTADKLEMRSQGVAPVQVTPLPAGAAPDKPGPSQEVSQRQPVPR